MSRFKVEWMDHGRASQYASDPDYPDGTDIDLSEGATRTCRRELAYPAPRCGAYLISCSRCGVKVGVTTAGRPDDPRSVTIACRPSA